MSRDFFCILCENRFDIAILELRTHNCKLDPAQRWPTRNPAYKKGASFRTRPGLYGFFLKERRQQPMYHISFVVHVEPFVVHGTIPLFSPRREIDKEGTGGEQGQTQARFNKKSISRKKHPSNPNIIPPYPCATAQHHTSTRASQVPIRAALYRRKTALHGDFRGLEGTFLLSYVEPA